MIEEIIKEIIQGMNIVKRNILTVKMKELTNTKDTINNNKNGKKEAEVDL